MGPAVDLMRALARLVPPEAWPEGEIWVPLDDYDYGKEMPPLARSLAAFGPAAIIALVEELEAFLAVQRPEREDGRHADLSWLWRPAIEDHEQNWDFEREAKLVIAIRDGFDEVLTRSPEELRGVVGRLLESPWQVVHRIALHLLVERGEEAPDLVEQLLTDRELLADDHHRHELYRLVQARFASVPPETQRQFIANVRDVAGAVVARAADRRPEADAEIIRNVVIRRWLGAVADHLEGADRAELEAARADTGEDPHPDFPAYHSSWRGSMSPLSSDELRDRTPDEVADFLATWQEPAAFGRHPSAEGLAQQLTDAVAANPDGFAPTAPRYLTLKPAYFDGLINGFQNAVQNDKPFDWEPVLASCESAIQMVDGEHTEDRDRTWEGIRMAVIRLLERGLEGKTVEIPFTLRGRVWSLISRLVEDPDPTPGDEARFGPPNMEPETYSLNTTRGGAFHTLFFYLLWHHRHAGKPEAWSIAERDPEASAVLDAHLDPSRDPSIAVRAAYGWWLPYVLDLDAEWVRGRAAVIVGDVGTDLERAAWEGFLFRAGPSRLAFEVFGPAYAAHAEQLAALDAKPENHGRAGDPVQFLISHLVRAWLWRPDVRDGLPLRTLLTSGMVWLVAEVVEEAGRLISGSEPEDITPELATAYSDLWAVILETTTGLEPDGLKQALAPFAWWFDSGLPTDWTLAALLGLLDRGITPDPTFAVFKRLPSLAAEHPEETLRVLEGLAERGDKDWSLRVHEGEIRQVLEVAINASDVLVKARAIAVVHRLGTFGLGGLASLLHPPAPPG